VARSLHLFKSNPISEDEVLHALQLPLFVKPNNGGSSIGMSKVTQSDSLGEALKKAFQEDDQVLVEEFIEGREFTIGVFKNKGIITTLPITEIKTSNTFFDFQAKYEGKSEEITPAIIDESIANQIRSTAKKIYEVFNCKGVIRIDFIYRADQQMPYMLEINTVPGQSEASIVPQQVRAMGWTLTDFYSMLIEEVIHTS
jgi:D-alanine-D-alanine ligase